VPRKRTVALLSALGIGVATAIVVPMLGSASAASFDQQTWVDDFDGAAGSRVDTSKWVYEKGFGEQWGNNEYQTYTDSTNNVRLDGAGHLVITARKEADGSYTSGRLKTMGKFSQKYGKFEANIKIPRGPGLLPAFWAMGNTGGWPANGEIDIMENVGGEPKTVYGTVHGAGFTGADTTGRGGHKSISTELSADFHRYGIEWKPDAITWTLDGIAYKTTTPSNIGGARWPFNDQPFYMLLNVAVGGDWPGKPVDSVLPEEMVIDWVKVSAYNPDGTPATPPPTTAVPTTRPTTVPPMTTRPPTAPTTARPPTTTRPPTVPTTVPPTTVRPTTAQPTPPATTPPVVVDPPAGNRAWTPYTAYSVGQLVSYNGVNYSVRQAHTSLPGWEPANVLALFLPV
jgi:beta-glucanase (GH16 family)